MLIDEVECAFDTTDFLVLDSFNIIHPGNIPADVSNEYGIESFELILGMERKKLISMTVKQQRKPLIGCEKSLTLALRKNSTARQIYKCDNHLEAHKGKMKLSFSLNEAYLFSRDVLPNPAVVLQLKLISLTSGARLFSNESHHE